MALTRYCRKHILAEKSRVMAASGERLVLAAKDGDLTKGHYESVALLQESWRLCSFANVAAPGSFLIDGIGGAVVYAAFSGIQMAARSNPSWGHLTALESIGALLL